MARVWWDLVGADRFDDEISDLPVDQAPAVSVDELARGRRKEESLRDARIASVELVDKPVGGEACINANDSHRRRNGPRRREVVDGGTVGIARDRDPASSDDLVDRTDDWKNKSWRACEVRAAVRTSDLDILHDSVTR